MLSWIPSYTGGGEIEVGGVIDEFGLLDKNRVDDPVLEIWTWAFNWLSI